MRLLSTTTLLLLATILFARTEKYRLTLRDNPATSIVIGWNQISGSNAVVYYGTTDYGTNWSSYPSSKSVSRSVTSKGMNNRFARLTGLAPNTAYYFVIRDNDGTSRRFWFKTAPNDPNARLSFIAGGDSRNNRTPRRNANLLVSKLKPHAVFFGGDMTDRSTNSQWQTWFDDWQLTISSDGRMYPIVATRGNHEGSNSDVVNLFDVPSSSVYYAITFGGGLIRTYTLNTEISISGSQTSWLSSDLSANRNVIWKMAQYHKPMRPHVSSKREGNSQYSNWANLFYTNDVKLVVECDAHTVKTTWPVRPSSGSGSDEGFIRDNQNGTVYVGEGCWGAPLRSNNDGKTWTRNSGRFNQFKWIFIDRNKIEVRTVRVDNASSVGQVSNSNPFTFPSNVDVWSPSNGSVVTIQNGSSGGGTTIPRPTNLAASSASSSSINLTWSDNSTGEDGFKIERRQGAGSWTQIGTATTGSTSYTSTGLSASTTYSYRIRAYLGSNHSTYSNTASATTQSSGGGSSCSSAASISEGFESGFGNWSFQSYDLNWTRQSGSTPSSGTGPSGAAQGNYYLYIEASSPNYPDKYASMISDCFSLTSYSSPRINFRYHMNGSSVGTLWVQARTNGGSWSTLQTINGSQGNSWIASSLSLASFASSSNVEIRIIGQTGDSWQGDICIDDITITNGSSSPTNSTFSTRISSGNDDVEENQSGGMYMDSSDVELVSDGSSGNQQIGLRFRGVTVPRGASVTNAYIQFNVDETGGQTNGAKTVLGHDTDNASAFTSGSFNVSSRTRTSASVSWNPPSWSSVGDEGSAQRTPNLAAIVQEIVNRSGWSNGNNMAFIITGTGKRTAEAYEGSSSRAPRLVITYTTSSGARTTSEVTASTTQNLPEPPAAIGRSVTVDALGVYPNPSRGHIQIKANANLVGTLLKVYGIDGAIVLNKIFETNDQVVISDEELTPGIYILKASDGDSHFEKKIIKN